MRWLKNSYNRLSISVPLNSTCFQREIAMLFSCIMPDASPFESESFFTIALARMQAIQWIVSVYLNAREHKRKFHWRQSNLLMQNYINLSTIWYQMNWSFSVGAFYGSQPLHSWFIDTLGILRIFCFHFNNSMSAFLDIATLHWFYCYIPTVRAACLPFTLSLCETFTIDLPMENISAILQLFKANIKCKLSAWLLLGAHHSNNNFHRVQTAKKRYIENH